MDRACRAAPDGHRQGQGLLTVERLPANLIVANQRPGSPAAQRAAVDSKVRTGSVECRAWASHGQEEGRFKFLSSRRAESLWRNDVDVTV